LAVSQRRGLLRQDHLGLGTCLRRGLLVATVVGGGYDALPELVNRHLLVFKAATDQARLHWAGI